MSIYCQIYNQTYATCVAKKKCNKDKISKCKEYNIFVWFLYILVGSIKIELIYFWKYLKVNESLKEVILQIV